MPRNTRATFTKVCEHCGRTYERTRHANGCLQNITQWTIRRSCSPECGNELRKKTYAARREQHLRDYEHPPCTHCNGPCPKRPDEKYKRWRQRKTCSQTCRLAAMRSANPGGTPANLVRGSKPRGRKKLANDGYVFDGKFPTPPTIKSGWVSVAGPDTGARVTFERNGVTRSPRTMRMLRAAVQGHPDLGTALTGTLADAWVQQDHAG